VIKKTVTERCGKREVFRLKFNRTITAIIAAVYLSLCMLEGFRDITLIDYGLPKILRSAKCEVRSCLSFPWYCRQRLPVKNVYSLSTHRQVHQPMLVKQACELSPPKGVKFNQACKLSPPKDQINALRCSVNVSRDLSSNRDIVSFS